MVGEDLNKLEEVAAVVEEKEGGRAGPMQVLEVMDLSDAEVVVVVGDRRNSPIHLHQLQAQQEEKEAMDMCK
jgi:hypothetical protein